MFRRSEKELKALERELMAVEAEEYEEEACGEEYEDEYGGEYEDEADCFEDEEEVPCWQETVSRGRVSRYGRGSPKKFDDKDFFDKGFDDTDVLYRSDYKKAKRKKRRRAFGLLLLAILELAAIGAVLLWFMSWIE